MGPTLKLNQLSVIALVAVLLSACVSESASMQAPASSSPSANVTASISTETAEPTQATNDITVPSVAAPTVNTTPSEEPSGTAPETQALPTTEPEVTTPPEAPAAQVEVLPWLRIPMHYDILLGRSQIWGEAEGTLSLNVATPALAKSSTIELNSTDDLLPLQLISYYGSDGQYYSAQIQRIEGKQLLLTTPLKQNIAAGPNAWNFYSNGSHPNGRGYQVIADYAVRFLGKKKLNEGVHILLGDSWFGDGSILERLNTHLPAASFINKGIGGNTSTDLLARFDDDVRPHNPNFVWIMSGTNDYWQDVTAVTYKANIDALINKIKAINATPIIIDSSVGPLNFGTETITELSQAYVTAVDQLLAEN